MICLERKKNLKTAKKIQGFNVIYDVCEVAVSLTADFTSGSAALMLADSKDTIICLYQTVVVLGGLLAVEYWDWWWADPVAALLIVPWALKEGREAYNNGKKINYDTGH